MTDLQYRVLKALADQTLASIDLADRIGKPEHLTRVTARHCEALGYVMHFDDGTNDTRRHAILMSGKAALAAERARRERKGIPL